jgi:D-glycerate 3-kinase
MLGFRPVDDASLEPDLRAPNQKLAAYDAWDSLLDAFVLLDASQLDDIVRWRVDAERSRRERGEPALSDDDARDYVERFLPAYRAYVPGLRERSIGRHSLLVRLGSDRHPTSIEER